MKAENSIGRPLFAACASATLLLVSSAAAQNVGIGESNPQSKLSVNGTTSSGGLAIGDSTYTSTAGTVAPTNGAIIQGHVGIGTNTPIAYLHVALGNVVNETNATSTYFNYNSTSPLNHNTGLTGQLLDPGRYTDQYEGLRLWKAT
jgi:hypothetical protein